MSKINKGLMIVVGFIAYQLTSCQAQVESILDNSYSAAVVDASTPTEKEISHNLLSVNQGNSQLIWNSESTMLLVVTWKAMQDYEHFIKPNTTTSENEEHVVWVTLAPQVRQFCNDFTGYTASAKEYLDLKLKQYLGLSREWNYDVFVELWVSPAELIRPCVDPEINDTSCNLNFGEQVPVVKNIEDYRGFYENLYYKSIRSSPGTPWTGLGYTYYWGERGSEIGASEFILIPGAAYEINQAIPTLDYCTQAARLP